MGMFTEPEREFLGNDRYGRPLPIPHWREKPNDNGYWFHAPKRENWDLARPVPVQKIEDGRGVYFQAKPLGAYDYINVNEIPGVWYGPIRVAGFDLPAEEPKDI